jgi:SAM-dependent methyltransferase
MTTFDTNGFIGSIPAIYDQYLAPIFFEPYAVDLALHLRDLRRGRLLELAAGTGVCTRALARAVSPVVEIVATDLSQPMLDFAASKIYECHITWRQADAAALPFGDSEFDHVVCQFGVMFFPDQTAAYHEVRRVLKPGGRFLFNVWSSLDNNEFALVVAEAVAALFPGDPPRFLARVPFAYRGIGDAAAALEAAGFYRFEMGIVEQRSTAPSPRHVAIGLCQGMPLRDEIRARDPGRLYEATDAATDALTKRFGDGPIVGRMQAIVVEAAT